MEINPVQFFADRLKSHYDSKSPLRVLIKCDYLYYSGSLLINLSFDKGTANLLLNFEYHKAVGDFVGSDIVLSRGCYNRTLKRSIIRDYLDFITVFELKLGKEFMVGKCDNNFDFNDFD